MPPRMSNDFMSFYNADEDGSTDYESDFEEEIDTYDEIRSNEGDEELVYNKYYIGGYHYDRTYNELIVTSTVKPATLFNHNINDITNYIREHSIIRTRDDLQPEILQIASNPETMVLNVILKTHWIRLIQRNWKRVLQSRNKIIRDMSFVKTHLNRELGGQNILLPNIRGMLHGI